MTSRRGPVFIVGAPRSGTTLMQYMLRSLPALSLPTGESHFFIPLYLNAAEYGDLSKPDNVRRVLEYMERKSAEFLYTDLHGLEFDIDKLTNDFVAEGRVNMRDIITGVFERNATGEGKSRWGDKTPYYVLHIPKLLDWWPDAQIIHIVRDGRDVALSMLARRNDLRVFNTYQVAEQWVQYVETGHSDGQSLAQDQYLELHYEDVVSDQKSALQTICAFLGEEYSDKFLNYKKAGNAGKTPLRLKPDIASKTPLLHKPVQKDNVNKWKDIMTRWDVRVFESVAADCLLSFGYTTVTSGKRLPLPLRALYRWHNLLLKYLHKAFGSKKTPWKPT